MHFVMVRLGPGPARVALLGWQKMLDGRPVPGLGWDLAGLLR